MDANKPSKFTPKQERFCREYVVDMNATQAASRAGYSPRTANEQGARLLANASVKSRIAELQAEVAERLNITVDDVIAMLLESYRDATAAKQHGPAVRAVELLGKRLGMFRDRVIVSREESMPDDDLVAALAGDDPHKAEVLREFLGRPTFDA